MCIISHGWRGWLWIRIIWRYEEMMVGVEIFVRLPGYAYLLWTRVKESLKHLPVVDYCCMHHVKVCVLLKINLYCGNKFWIYFVDFVVVSLVSCIAIIARGLWVRSMRSWRLGRAVFSDEAFHVIMYVEWLLVTISWCIGTGLMGRGRECVYWFGFWFGF